MEGLVPVVVVEEGGEVGARMEAAEVAGVVAAEGVSTGEHSKLLSSNNPLILFVFATTV